jgi:hypothetical protein
MQASRQTHHSSVPARHEEERPQKAGAGAGEVVTQWADRHVRPGIGGIKAYNFYDFFVAALKVIYHAVRRCGAFLVIQEARDRHAVTVRCVRPSPPALRPPDPIANARSLSLAGADGDGRAEC